MTNAPRIENADRGITLNKSLAWAMVVGLLGAGLFVGREVQGAQEQQEMVLEKLSHIEQSQALAQTRNETARGQLDARLRAVETMRANDSAEITGLRRDLSDFRLELREAVAAITRRSNQP